MTLLWTTDSMVVICAIDEVNYTSFDEGSFRRHPMTLLWTTDSMVVIRAIDEVNLQRASMMVHFEDIVGH